MLGGFSSVATLQREVELVLCLGNDSTHSSGRNNPEELRVSNKTRKPRTLQVEAANRTLPGTANDFEDWWSYCWTFYKSDRN